MDEELDSVVVVVSNCLLSLAVDIYGGHCVEMVGLLSKRKSG